MIFLLNYVEKYEKMREVGKWTTQCLDELTDFIKPGITSNQVDNFVKEFGEKHNLENADYGYKGYPAYSCTSLNEVMCHGIPNDDIIEVGVLKVDVTFRKEGYHGDACRTYIIGDVPATVQDFVEIARNAMLVGLQQCGPGATYGSIGLAIESYANHNKVFVARDFVGHGIGLNFHDQPQICHVEDRNDLYFSAKMEPGVTFTVEPIIMMSSGRYKKMWDGWGVRQKEKKLTAQWESTIGITINGYEIFAH